MGNSIWGPYGAHMDVPRWVPDESLLQNPHRSHMGCPYRTHINTHMGPIWVPYSLLAGINLLSPNNGLSLSRLGLYFDTLENNYYAVIIYILFTCMLQPCRT